MTDEKKKVIVTVPHRISGFFEIIDNPSQENSRQLEEKIGSRGAGFNLTALGTTKISFQKLLTSEKSRCEIYINDERLDKKAETTYYIFEQTKKDFVNPLKIEIEHTFDLPVGCGYGASGSGALGTIFGLNKLLSLGYSESECGRRAHISEVVNKTGLGTVCGQLQGGLCILNEPGFPCISNRIVIPKRLKVICGTFGPIETKSILSHPDLNLRIKKAGERAMKKLKGEPNINTFIKSSREFVYETKMMDILNLTETKELIEELNKINILGASMNQLGRSVYCICQNDEVDQALEIFKSYEPKIRNYIFEINEDKAINYL